MFSRIATQLHADVNTLYALRDEIKRQGHEIRDLISGNINEQGFMFPQETLEEILIRGSRQCSIYRPDSFGRRSAREAVSEYYLNCGCTIDPDCILLTPGTSMSYWYCFKLLADEGDEILCPVPSYPLFDYIAMLSGVRLVPYPLDETQNWAIDLQKLEDCISMKTRALVLISPHNPTGHVASSEEIAGLTDIAQRHDLAIISDEVFSEFLLSTEFFPRPAAGAGPLVFTLNGFSKMFALPGIKFGWMAVSGESQKVRQAMRSLELISDTFLPVNEIVQASASEIFHHGEKVRLEFGERIRKCWQLAEGHLAPGYPCTWVKPDGGFYVTLCLGEMDEEKTAEALMRDNHMLVHPGFFYDMDPNHLVLSFVQKPEIIRDTFPEMIKTLGRLMCTQLTKNSGDNG
jgi:alanine-synthesizing transaminase